MDEFLVFIAFGGIVVVSVVGLALITFLTSEWIDR